MIYRGFIIEKRIKISSDEGVFGVKLINYASNENVYTCNEYEWKVYELKRKLIKEGIDEKLADEFEDAVREVCEYDRKFC